jgi:hypothetical protein
MAHHEAPKTGITGSTNVCRMISARPWASAKKFSLQPRDPLEAKRRHVVALAALDSWAICGRRYGS